MCLICSDGYSLGFFVLSAKGVNHPFHHSCAQKALAEWEDNQNK